MIKKKTNWCRADRGQATQAARTREDSVVTKAEKASLQGQKCLPEAFGKAVSGQASTPALGSLRHRPERTGHASVTINL